MKNKKPEIRFKGFSEEWEEKKLGEITNSYSGGTPSVGNREFYDGDIPFIRSGEINSALTEIFITEKGLQNSSAKFVEKGDLLYALYGATSGEVGISQIKGAINQAILAIKPIKGFDSHVIAQWLRKEKSVIIDKYLQGGQGNLSGGIVKELEINLPQIQEQTQIGNFFKNLDSLITLHQRKVEKLGILKKAMLEKMFPKNGADVPEIRFKGFEGTWEERTLGDIVQIKDSARVPKELWTESGVQYLRSSDLENNGQGGELFISMESYDSYKLKTGVPEVGDVLFNSGGDIGFSILKTDDVPVYVQGGAILYARTSQSKEVDGGYLNIYFSTPQMIKYIGMASAGGTIKHFTLKPANAAPFIFPDIIEQRKVSEFFVQLDNLLKLHQGELTKLKNLKKAMLEKMFV